MASESVRYFSPTERAVVMVVAMIAASAGAIAARLTDFQNDFLFLIVLITPLLAALAALGLWSRRPGPQMTPKEREARYVFDTLHAPYWQALLIQGAFPIMTCLTISLLSAPPLEAIAIALPIGGICGAAVLSFEQWRARRLLAKPPSRD